MIAKIAIAVLKLFAWIVLLMGIGGSLLFIVTAIAATRTTDYSSFSPYTPLATLSTGLILIIGIVIAFESLGAWAFLLVTASMAENLIEIRSMTYQNLYGRSQP